MLMPNPHPLLLGEFLLEFDWWRLCKYSTKSAYARRDKILPSFDIVLLQKRKRDFWMDLFKLREERRVFDIVFIIYFNLSVDVLVRLVEDMTDNTYIEGGLLVVVDFLPEHLQRFISRHNCSF